MSSCGGNEHYWKSDKEVYECKKCKYRQSLKANTVMHGSQLPFRYWFVAIHLLTSTKKSFSAAELQRQLGHSTYNPIWALLHKLRSVMGKRGAEYRLEGVLELDEGFFSTAISEEEKDLPLKCGRGSKSKVLVMAESMPVENHDKYDKLRKVNHIKMLMIEDLKLSTIDKNVKEYVDKKSIIDSDASTSYTHIKTLVAPHRPEVIPKKEIGKAFPWIDIAISNAKQMLLDIFHDIKPEYFQNYLNEFCYNSCYAIS